MTIGGWILFLFFSAVIIAIAAVIAASSSNKITSIGCIIAGFVLVIALYAGMHWWYTSTEAGSRAFKSQESNFSGGLNRTVTVYDYSGGEIRSWSGKFDVTESEVETWFDIDGKRVIIQGGIIINEEN